MAKYVLVVFGTRPEGIKMLPVVKALRRIPYLETKVAVTGQHREMLDQVFAVFNERPDIDLNLMTPNQTLAGVTANVILRMTDVLNDLKPDVILVHGDTTTAMATAIAGFYCRCRVGHVEAGLRTHDLQRPWPEEFNRVTIDSIADYQFAPTISAKNNLQSEYNQRAKIIVTGNTGIDALLFISDTIDRDIVLQNKLAARYDYLDPHRHLILVTGHRRESFGEGFQRICDGLISIAERPDIEVLYPVHLNPAVRATINFRLHGRSNIRLIDPVEYVDMVYLMKRAKIIVTDSGGIQEEGPALGRPVLVMRDVTERPEALTTGVVKLIGTDRNRMRAEVDLLLDDHGGYRSIAVPVFPYGNGTAATKIAEFIGKELTP